MSNTLWKEIDSSSSSSEALWKMYSKAKASLPYKDRMQNLTWRMMSIKLMRQRIIPNSLPATANTANTGVFSSVGSASGTVSTVSSRPSSTGISFTVNHSNNLGSATTATNGANVMASNAPAYINSYQPSSASATAGSNLHNNNEGTVTDEYFNFSSLQPSSSVKSTTSKLTKSLKEQAETNNQRHLHQQQQQQHQHQQQQQKQHLVPTSTSASSNDPTSDDFDYV
ncbi:hypothetical protein WICPIJ_002398, partial [Wickerhamomyces pijperi]